MQDSVGVSFPLLPIRFQLSSLMEIFHFQNTTLLRTGIHGYGSKMMFANRL